MSTLNRETRMSGGRPGRRAMSRRGAVWAVKRGIDIVGAAIGLVLASPMFLIVAVATRRSLGRPVLFRQVRPGLHGKPFELVKFRTMRDAVDAAGRPLPDAERMTPLGTFLRRTSLDELPEL